MEEFTIHAAIVTSRKGRVSRNENDKEFRDAVTVTSRKRRVSRNDKIAVQDAVTGWVTSRKGRVSRNNITIQRWLDRRRHVP